MPTQTPTPTNIKAQAAPSLDMIYARILAGVYTQDQARDDAWAQAGACVAESNRADERGNGEFARIWTEQAARWVAIADEL